ncbi:MAG: hypothetical protein ACJ8FY_22905 [Gemmataceae bacterium]
MTKTFRLSKFVFYFTACVMLLALTCLKADEVTKPFKVTGSGVGPQGLPLPGQDPRPHTIEIGNGTYLGRYTGEGTVKTDSAAFDPVTGHITGEFGSGSPFIFKKKNGDQLACNYGRTDLGASKPGFFDLTILDVLPDGSLIVEALFIAEFVPQADLCTGMFEGVTGGWIMYAITEPFVLGSSAPLNYSWQGQGSLTFEEQ